MLDALTAMKYGSNVQSVKAYLDARYAYDIDSTENVESLVANAPHDKNLEDNWDYLRAALLSETTEKSDALAAFKQHAEKYPHSEKNEAVLYMIAKLTMQSSYSFEKSGCILTDKNEWGQTIDAAKIEPKEKCQDASWHSAVKDFQQLIRKYPHGGRYFNDAHGWLAYLYRRGEERSPALTEYYRLLGNPTDRYWRLEAKKSLQMIGDEYDDETLDEVEKSIADEPDTAMAYAYYRIYNYATDHTYEMTSSWCCYDENNRWQEEQDEKERVASEHDTGNHELNRVARFATAMMKRYPQANISGGFVLRVAEAQLELQNYADALNLSKKALSLGLHDDLRSQALWIKGSAENEGKDYRSARATFNQLIAEFPKSKLTEGARRLLAMTAEDQDDLETALEQYLALDYQYDVAYFVDVLLPTDRLAKFVNSHQNIPKYNPLLYGLGVRYMRDKRWEEARGAFRQVITKSSITASDDGASRSHPAFPKETGWDYWDKPTFIESSWVMQDMQTIDALENLERSVDAAQGDEAKAEAMYQLASYEYSANDLLFYNPTAWHGQRYELLSDLNGSERMRLPGESENLFRYSKSHETLARAIPIYMEIVEHYPNTKAAKDALYSVAVAQERLSDLNPYWRDIYGQGLFVGSKKVTYDDVKRIYPGYQLPRGTNGWEPSTRTVNGGPAYPPPPKPAPKVTRTQKVVKILKRIADEFSTMAWPKITTLIDDAASFLRGCFYGLLAIAGMLAIGFGVLSELYFRKTRLADSGEVLGLLDAGLPEKLPDSESRMAKVIEDS